MERLGAITQNEEWNEEEFRGRRPVSGQDKNRRHSRSRSITRRLSQVLETVKPNPPDTKPSHFILSPRGFTSLSAIGISTSSQSPVQKRPSSRSVSRARCVTIDESILLYEKSRANASIQLRLNQLLAGWLNDSCAWYLRIGVSIARGRLDIKDAIFRLKFRCPDCSNMLWRIKRYSPLRLLGRGPDVNYVDTRSTEVGAQVGRDEAKGETKFSFGKERSYVQENCYALELAETNNRLQAHLWRVGDASTVVPPSHFSLQVVVAAPCSCYEMEITADLDINKGSEKSQRELAASPAS